MSEKVNDCTLRQDKYTLRRDDDGHWYIVRLDIEDEFDRLLTEIYNKQNYDIDLENIDGIYRVNSYRIIFSDWYEE